MNIRNLIISYWRGENVLLVFVLTVGIPTIVKYD